MLVLSVVSENCCLQKSSISFYLLLVDLGGRRETAWMSSLSFPPSFPPFFSLFLPLTIDYYTDTISRNVWNNAPSQTTVFWSPRSDNLKCVLRDHNSRHFPFWSFSAYCFIISTWKKSLERLVFWGVWIFLFVCLFWSAYDLTRKRNLYFVTNSRHLILCYKLTLLQNRMIPVSWFFRKSFKELTRVPLARQLLGSPTGWLPTKASRQKAK